MDADAEGQGGAAPLRGGAGVPVFGATQAPTPSPFARLAAAARPARRSAAGGETALPRELDREHLAAICQLTKILLLWHRTRVTTVKFSFLRFETSKGQMAGGRFWPTLRDSNGNVLPSEYATSQLMQIQGAYYRALEFQRASAMDRKPASLYMEAIDSESGPTFPWYFLDDVRREQFESEAFGEDFQIVLETSQNNFQAWFLSDAIPASKYERSEKQGLLARHLGADKNAGGFARLARAPGSINWKEGKNRFSTKLIRCDERAAELAKNLPYSVQGGEDFLFARNLTKSDWISVIQQFEASRPWRPDWRDVEYAIAEIERGHRGDHSEDDWRECHRLIFTKRLRPLFVMQALALASLRRAKHSPEDYAARTICKLIQRVELY